MSLFRFQRFVWVPLQRQHLVATLLSALAMITLGAFGFAGFPALKSYGDIRAPAAQLLVFDVALILANYVFIVRQALASYLRPRQVFAPALASLVILSIAAFAVASWLKPPSAPIDPAAMQAAQPAGGSAIAVPLPPETRWEGLLKRLLVAEGGLAALILAAGLWKNDDEAVASLAGSLRRIRQLHDQISRGIAGVDQARPVKRGLIFHLGAVDNWIESNEYSAEIEGIGTLKSTCGDAATAIAEIDVGEFLLSHPNGRSHILKLLDPIVRFG